MRIATTKTTTMSLNSGVCIGCDYPGCTANSDDYPAARGARMNNMKNLFQVLLDNGWMFERSSTDTQVRYYCKEHENGWHNMADQRHPLWT